MQNALILIDQNNYSILCEYREYSRYMKCKITSSQLGFLTFAKTEEEKIQHARYMLKLDKKVFTDEELLNMQIGTDYEDNVRKYISKREGKQIYPVGIFINRKYPFFSGAPDGIMDDGNIIEIKISSKDVPETYSEDFSEIPIYYLHQMYFNMYNMNSPNCLFIMFSRKSGKIYTRIVPFNLERFNNEILIPCLQYYDDIMIPICEENNIPCPYESFEQLLLNREKNI